MKRRDWMLRAIVSMVGMLSCMACASPWQEAETVDDRVHIDVQDPQPACAIAGSSTVVVFNRTIALGPPTGGELRHTWARVHDGTAWSGFADLGSTVAGSDGQTQLVAGSADGTAIALVRDGATRYAAGAWSAPTPLMLGAGQQVAMDGSGHGLVVGGGASGVMGSFFDPASAWSAPFSVGAGASSQLAVAMNTAGGAVVGWCSGGNTWANVCGPDHAWFGAVQVHAGCYGYSPLIIGTTAVDVGIAGDGTAFVASTGAGVSVSRFDAITHSWSSSLSAPGSFSIPKMAINEAGRGLLAYEDAMSPSAVRARSYAPGTGWSAENLLATGIQYTARAGVGLDAAGWGHIAYVGHSGRDDEVRDVEYNQATGAFASPRLLETLPAAAYYICADTAENGRSVVAWNGSPFERIYAARYVPGG